MYVIDPHSPPSRTESQSYAAARATADRAFRVVQREFVRAATLDSRGDEKPLTGLERLELAALCAALAGAFERAANAWDPLRAGRPIAAAYRRSAYRLHDASARHTTFAEFAPAHALHSATDLF